MVGCVSKKRAEDPSLVGDEFIVLKAAPNAIGDHLDLVFFPASAEAQARSFAAMVKEQEKPEAARDAAVMATDGRRYRRIEPHLGQEGAHPPPSGRGQLHLGRWTLERTGLRNA